MKTRLLIIGMIVLIGLSVFVMTAPDSYGLIMGHPLEFWADADIILDGTVISTTKIDSEKLVQHDVKVEQMFKSQKPQEMITIYGPDMHNEQWFYPKTFEQGDRVLFYLKQVDNKYILLPHSLKATEQCMPREMIGLNTLPGEKQTRVGLTLFFNPYQTCNGFLTPAEMVRNSVSPLKQLGLGITQGDIHCRNDNQLMFRENGSVACVKKSSVLPLMDRGWMHVDNQDHLQFKSALPTILLDAPKQIDDSTILDFIITIRDFVENNKRPIITITDENQNIVWTGQHNFPDNAGWYGIGSGYYVVYMMNDYSDEIMLDEGTYLLSISLDNQKITKKLTVVKSEFENMLRPDDRLEISHKAGYTIVHITLSSWDEYIQWEKDRGPEHDLMPPVIINDDNINPIVLDLLNEMWIFEDYEVSKYNKNLFTKKIQKDYSVPNHHGIHDWLEFEHDKQFGKTNDGFSNHFEYQDNVYTVTMLAID